MDLPPPPPPPRALPVAPLVLLTPQVWEVIAGAVAGVIAAVDAVPDPSVRIPAVGAEVRYLPHLHASSSAQLPAEHIPCYVHDVILLADPVTLELLAEVTLSRHQPQHPLPAPAPAPLMPIRFFTKRVSQSDVDHDRIFVGVPGDRLFGKFRAAKDLTMQDVSGTSYVVHRNANRLINTGWPLFSEGKDIRIRDRVVFLKRGGDFLIGLRRFFSQEERELARAPEQDVLHLVNRLQGGEPVRVTFYPGRSGTFLVEPEPEPEPEVHTPPPSDSEEDEVPSVVVLSSGSETDIPAAQETEEDVVPSIIDASSDSETESSGSEMDDDSSDYSTVSLDGEILDPDRPVPRVTRMTGIPLPRGVRVKALIILYTPLRGRRGI